MSVSLLENKLKREIALNRFFYLELDGDICILVDTKLDIVVFPISSTV